MLNPQNKSQIVLPVAIKNYVEVFGTWKFVKYQVLHKRSAINSPVRLKAFKGRLFKTQNYRIFLKGSREFARKSFKTSAVNILTC